MMMESSRYAIGNGIVTDGLQVLMKDGAVLIDGGDIERIAPTEEIRREGIPVIDVHGRLILPGLTNFHHHLYSFFASGLSPQGPTDDFVGILENLWWPLDAAMDEETVYYSALCGIIDSIKHGVTTIFDHHASLRYVSGSLSTIARAFQIAGIKGVLCFEISDRLGKERVKEHVEENFHFWREGERSSRLRGLLGLHANMTLSESSMRLIADLRPSDMPIHVHCGEGEADLNFCRKMGYEGPVDRLHRYGLLSRNSLLAHCIHLSDRDFELIEEIQPVIVSNPESNANNDVGRMDRRRIREYVLGTDGMTGDMLGTLRSAYLLGCQDGITFEELDRAFFGRRYEVQSRFFPKAASLTSGMNADIAVLDYVPLTEIDLSNLMGHLIFGVRGGNVFMTVAEGKILWRQGEITFLNEETVNRTARKISAGFHERYRNSPWRASFGI